MRKTFTKMTTIVGTLLLSIAAQRSSAQVVTNCTANAGGNAIICGATTTLVGGVSGTVGAGNPSWTFVSGPVVPTILSPNTLTTGVTGMTENGDYVFTLSHPCGTGVATSNVTITAHPRPATFTAGADDTTICATVGATVLSGVIPAGYTGEWRAVNIYSLVRFGTTVSTNAQFSSLISATPTFSLINQADHQIDPAYYAILKITSLDGVCSYEDTTVVRFVPNPEIIPPTTLTQCRVVTNTRYWIDLNSSSPGFATDYAGAAGTPAAGTNVSVNVISQPVGASLGYDEVESRRVYLTGMTENGTYLFTISVSNSCGSYTTDTISYTFSGTTPHKVDFALSAHPEQSMVYATGGSGGEVHCTDMVGSTTPETFYFDIDPADPPTVVSSVYATGIMPPGGAPTIVVSGAGTYNRMATVTPPTGGWQAGTYKFSVQTANNDCVIGQSYYIHVSDNNRPDVTVPDQSVCYPGTGAIAVTIPLPAVYKQVVNSSYFQDFNGNYDFSVISKPAGSATPVYTSYVQRRITDTATTISNLNMAGDYVFSITASPSTGGVGPFLDQEYSCSGSSLSGTFTIHVENPTNANAGSDQFGVCSQTVTLLGNSPGSGSGVWTIAQAPAGATPTITAPGSASTVAAHLDSVGLYQFVWSITSPLGGCLSADTVSYEVTCPLPVSLTDFSARHHEQTVQLDWSVIADEHYDHCNLFVVARSAEGRTWHRIGVVNCQMPGTQPSSALTYQYIDAAPMSGKNFYRLRQEDYDGQFQYSPVRMVRLYQAKDIVIYPNPVSEQVTLSGLNGGERITIMDVFGRTLLETFATPDRVAIPLSQLADGAYLIQVSQDDHVLIKQKMIKVH